MINKENIQEEKPMSRVDIKTEILKFKSVNPSFLVTNFNSISEDGDFYCDFEVQMWDDGEYVDSVNIQTFTVSNYAELYSFEELFDYFDKKLTVRKKNMVDWLAELGLNAKLRAGYSE